MLKQIRSFVNNRDERGSAELPVTIIMLPFVLFLLFALIDMSLYLNTRSNVQSVLRDGTRLVALYGGNSSGSPLNPTGRNIDAIVKDRLWQNGACTKSNCDSQPIVSCTPNLARNIAQDVSCSVTYDYRPVVYDVFFGFTNISDAKFTITETSISETRF